MQYIATNALREESPIVQATGGVGIGMVAHGLTQSDCRSWTTLPKQIQFCKIPCGRSTELTLRGVETKLENRYFKTCNRKSSLGKKYFRTYTSTNCESICSATLENEKSSFY